MDIFQRGGYIRSKADIYNMPKFFVQQKQVEGNKLKIQDGDVNHIKNVLRMKPKENINVCIMPDGINTICQIEKIEEKEIICSIIKKEENTTESNIKVSIFQGLPKSDKMELIIQKSVELGVYNIFPVEMKRCVVKLKEQDTKKKITRWQKISEVAAKQCGRDIIPEIKECIKIDQICEKIPLYDKIIVAYEEEKETSLKQELAKIKNNHNKELKIGIVIGTEGGIDYTEIEKLKKAGAEIVTLGKRILRTETVALNVLSNIMYEFEQEQITTKDKK